MANSPFETKKFKELQTKWYKKLEKSGFEDAEKDGYLKSWSIDRRHSKTGHHREYYYRLASQFLHTHPFSTPTEKFIWELHAEGLSLLDIKAKLARRRIKIYLHGIRHTINTLSALMLKESGGTDA